MESNRSSTDRSSVPKDGVSLLLNHLDETLTSTSSAFPNAAPTTTNSISAAEKLELKEGNLPLMSIVMYLTQPMVQTLLQHHLTFIIARGFHIQQVNTFLPAGVGNKISVTSGSTRDGSKSFNSTMVPTCVRESLGSLDLLTPRRPSEAIDARHLFHSSRFGPTLRPTSISTRFRLSSSFDASQSLYLPHCQIL